MANLIKNAVESIRDCAEFVNQRLAGKSVNIDLEDLLELALRESSH